MSVQQNLTEFYASDTERNERAAELRQQGWTVSVGQMRREDGKDFYVRAWRRTPRKGDTWE